MTAVRAPVHPLHDPFIAARSQLEAITAFLLSPEGLAMNHANMERELAQQALEMFRRLYQGWLDRMAPGEALEPVIDASGEERTRVRRQLRELATVFGPVWVRRAGYGAEGQDSLRPLDAQLNLPEELYSLELRRRVAREAAKSSFDEVVEAIAESTGTAIPKRQVEELTQRAAQDFDAFYATRQAAAMATHESAVAEPTAGSPGSADSLVVITTDGKGVAMHRDDLRPATRAAAEAHAANPDRAPLGKCITQADEPHGTRMATVASVYTVAPHQRTAEQIVHELSREPDAPRRRRKRKRKDEPEEPPPRPRPTHKRVWASLERDPVEVIEEAFDEASSRDPARAKTWVAVVDGNPHQLALLKAAAKNRGVIVTIVLDLFHVLQYLWQAGRALEGGGRATQTWVLDRVALILDGKAGVVAGGMRRSATTRGLTAEQRKPVDKCADYLLKYRDYLKYHEYLAAGLPIASGVIEGACRHLVQDRMGRTGARWRLPSAEAVLRLRALRASGDFDEYWEFHEDCEFDRLHAGRYHQGRVPAVVRVEPPLRPGA